MLIENLCESNFENLNWAINGNVIYGSNPYRNRIKNGTFDDASIVWVNIEDIFSHTEKDFTLDLSSPNGGENSIGNRVDKAKSFFNGGGYMNPSEIGISSSGKHIVFDDGRHRLVAAYQLGARYAPVIVLSRDVGKVTGLVRTNTQPDNFSTMKSILSSS